MQNGGGFRDENAIPSLTEFISGPVVNNCHLCPDRWKPRVAINLRRTPTPPLCSPGFTSLGFIEEEDGKTHQLVEMEIRKRGV